ncbi:hypothetical protein BH10BDE1_BH10BDE1_27310 [soil metagenome]
MKNTFLSHKRHGFGISLLAVLALAQSACSVTDTSGTSGLVCPASIAEKTETPLDVSSFAVPVTAQAGDVSTFSNFTVTGNVVYERYFPRVSTPFGLDYTGATVAKGTLPVRRAIVQVMSGTTPLASGMTDDNGNYSVPTVTPMGTTLFVRVLSRSTTPTYTADGIGGPTQENCNGGGWDIRVVNNVTNNSASTNDPSLRPQYALDSSTFAAPAMGGVGMSQMTAALTWNSVGSTYSERAGAPFALLDTAISAIETACQGRAAIVFPVLYMNWSIDNTNTNGNRYAGNITTSFFTTETSAKTANLYILGKNGVDTDELDNHVVAHEFGHFLENKIYRSDSIGGSHSSLDHLDTRLAFGEGFGNAFSGMVHSDPIYTDTSGTAQATGFRIDVSAAPGATALTPIDDKGLWSEASMQYLLYHLWSLNSNSFSRIHNILENFQKTTSAVTNGLTFASYYAQVYGAASEDLSNTWSGAGFMSSPINALCTGPCSGAVYSPFDKDNDLGFGYAAGTGAANERHYKQNSGSTFPAPFWQIYRPLVSGANPATTHDKISWGGYSVSSTNLNKFGLHRLYTVTATSSTTTVSVTSISQGSETCASNDLLDMAVYGTGVLLGADEKSSGSTSNCPSVTFCTTAGQTYVIDVIGFGTVNAYNLSVSP